MVLILLKTLVMDKKFLRMGNNGLGKSVMDYGLVLLGFIY